MLPPQALVWKLVIEKWRDSTEPISFLEAAVTVTVVSMVSPLDEFFGLILILMAWSLEFQDSAISGGSAYDLSSSRYSA